MANENKQLVHPPYTYELFEVKDSINGFTNWHVKAYRHLGIKRERCADMDRIFDCPEAAERFMDDNDHQEATETFVRRVTNGKIYRR